MRRSYRGRPQQPKTVEKEFRINEKILVTELMVIDDEGKSLGLLSKEAAIAAAQERGLDLVEVSPKAVPPIAKFLDYGSYRYQQAKAQRKAKAKAKTVEIKTVKISNRISQHDRDVRIDRSLKFLGDGDKVKIELQLRGREHQHADLAKETLQKVVESIKEQFEKPIKIEQPVTQQGSRISTIISS
jgi:translation initiation factor IF-3